MEDGFQWTCRKPVCFCLASSLASGISEGTFQQCSLQEEDQLFSSIQVFLGSDVVSKVHWCSEPIWDAGFMWMLSPRTLLRFARKLERKAGPSSMEFAHSYAIVDIGHDMENSYGDVVRYFRLNWGAMNLRVHAVKGLPPSRIMGKRLEASWPSTCSGTQLYDFLKRWEGRPYDPDPRAHTNCHHFVQDLLQQCTSQSSSFMM
eukprot:TRINITY_DN51040_c0_g1_i1.p1 TRINITY_DN51040_c0_g1~~TRINITY_DN51040_c0_g1_i1.p1  ORF type:complete len:203 (-),score=22.98 TRINITY_DN51040_c0_g1_i1:185-793(-)